MMEVPFSTLGGIELLPETCKHYYTIEPIADDPIGDLICAICYCPRNKHSTSITDKSISAAHAYYLQRGARLKSLMQLRSAEELLQ